MTNLSRALKFEKIFFCFWFFLEIFLSHIIIFMIYIKWVLQIISDKADTLVSKFRSNNYAVTVLDIRGIKDNKNKMLLIEIGSDKLEKVKNIIKSIDNNAFVMINETKYVYNGYLANKKGMF